jgi:hypothetical protein
MGPAVIEAKMSLIDWKRERIGHEDVDVPNAFQQNEAIFAISYGSAGFGILCVNPRICVECSQPRSFFRNRNGRTRCLSYDQQYVLRAIDGNQRLTLPPVAVF